MFDSDLPDGAATVLAQLHASLDELSTLDLTGPSDGELLALWRELETVRRRFAPVDHAIISEAQSRHLEFTCGARSITVLARQVLRVGIGEASARVRAADALASRRSFTGEALAPIYARIAAAQANGSVAEAAARVIIGTIEKLPDAVKCEYDEWAERFLTDQAAVLDLDGLRQVARRLHATLDPDGLLKDCEYRHRHRDLRFTVRPDGSAHFEGEATAELVEFMRTALAPLTKPRPSTDGVDSDGSAVTVKDTRTRGQRLHDGLLEALKLLARAEVLPDAGGVTTTVLLTMTADAFAAGEGTATTGHNVIIPVPEALSWCGGDTLVIPIVKDHSNRLTGIGTGQRLFSKRQRLALIARDGGCSFPGCDAPPQWTEAHHVTEHQAGGATCTDNGTLLCGFHHRSFEPMGWSVTMTDGIPEWTPPPWLDRSVATRRTPHPTPPALDGRRSTVPPELRAPMFDRPTTREGAAGDDIDS